MSKSFRFLIIGLLYKSLDLAMYVCMFVCMGQIDSKTTGSIRMPLGTKMLYISGKVWTTLEDASHVWNSLPLELKNCTSINIFKQHLKTYLFRKHFSEYF